MGIRVKPLTLARSNFKDGRNKKENGEAC